MAIQYGFEHSLLVTTSVQAILGGDFPHCGDRALLEYVWHLSLKVVAARKHIGP